MDRSKQKIDKFEQEIYELKKAILDFDARILALEKNRLEMNSRSVVSNPKVCQLNCWEFKKCGREPGGKNVQEFGVCPATEMEKYDGINRGRRGGRVCWSLVGTLCDGQVQGLFAKKCGKCKLCDFYKYVQEQEGKGFQYKIIA